MIPFNSLVSYRLIETIAATLVHFLWQGAVIGAALAILLRAAARCAAILRYIASVAALVLMTACPIVTAALVSRVSNPVSYPAQGNSREIARVYAAPERTTPVLRGAKATELLLSSGTETRPIPSDGLTAALHRGAPWIFLAWVCGCLILSIRMLGGWALAHRTTVRAIGNHSASLDQTLAGLAARMNVTRLPRLIVSAVAASPLLIGAYRTTIVLPVGLLSGLTPAMVEAILAHELAHVRRHDYLVNLAQCFVETVLFYHPAVWWVSARIRDEREVCCDDLVIATLNDRATYARALAGLETLRVQPLTLAATGGAFLARIRRILGVNEMQHDKRSLLAPAVAALALAAVCGPVCLRAITRHGTASASIISVVGKSSPLIGGTIGAARRFQTAGGIQVTGTVRTPDGKPVKDATVYWIERNLGVAQRRLVAETDPHGQFRFPEHERPINEYSAMLLVRSADWGLTFQRLPASQIEPLAITLEPPVSLRVLFTDQADKPLPNLHIRVSVLYSRKIGSLQMPEALHGRWEQTADAKGECVFPALTEGIQVRFGVQEEAFATPGYEDTITLGNAAIQSGRMRLLPGGVVKGRVTYSESRKPAAGIRVGAQAVGIGDGWGGSVTDSNGAYRIARLRPGAYNVAISLPYGQENSVTTAAYEKLTVGPGSTLENKDFRLIPGSRISGRVTDKSTGQPISGVHIGIYGPAHPRSGAAVQGSITDPDGMYHARVPPGLQYVYVSGVMSKRYERPEEGFNITLGEDASVVQNFALTLSPTQNLKPVHGRVVGADGKPVPGARITYIPMSKEPQSLDGREIAANANGEFSLEMTTASARLRAYSGNMFTDKTALVQSGEEITLHVKTNVLLTLHGRVANDKGTPVPNARVTLIEWWLDMGQSGPIAQTDAQGKFTFAGLYPDAGYSVQAEAAGYGSNGTHNNQYKPGDNVELPIIKLAGASSFVAGHVVDDSGDPIAGQQVRLQGRNNKLQETVTDARGRFRFESVVNEPIELYLVHDTGFSTPKRAATGDKDVIIVRKSGVKTATEKAEDRQAASRKTQVSLLSQPGPPLKAAAWLNTSTQMPDGLKGKIVLVDFWAIGCGPCVASLPAVQRVSEEFVGRGVVVVGLHGSGMEKDRLASFVRAHKLTYPIAIDSDDPKHGPNGQGQTMNSYGILGIPAVAVLDRQGTVRYLDYGLEGAVKTIGEILSKDTQ